MNMPRSGRSPSARALLFTVLAEYVRDPSIQLWSNTLVEALGALDIAEPAARRAIARAGESGWIVPERDGRRVRWQATSDAFELFQDARHEAYTRRRAETDWDGTYLLLIATVSESQRPVRHVLRTRLTWLGFGAIGRGIWISPRLGIAPKVRVVLDELGLSDSALSFMSGAGPIGSEYQIVNKAWDLAALARDYQMFVAQLQRATPPTSDLEAFTQLTRLIHRWRHFLLTDPWLPRELLPAGWLGHAAREQFYEMHDANFDAASRWLLELNEPDA